MAQAEAGSKAIISRAQHLRLHLATSARRVSAARQSDPPRRRRLDDELHRAPRARLIAEPSERFAEIAVYDALRRYRAARPPTWLALVSTGRRAQAPSVPTLYEDHALREREDIFHDRAHAGALLAELLQHTSEEITRVLAIPAGGLPVAMPVAQALSLPLDVAVTSKITLPWNQESGYGAVSFDGSVLLNDALLRELPLTREQIDEGIERTRRKVARRAQRFRGTAQPPVLLGEAVVLVDDGLASGITMRAAAQACRAAGARRVGVAVPTAHVDASRALAGLADFVACLNVRTRTPYAVANAYERWHDVLELQAQDLLQAHCARTL